MQWLIAFILFLLLFQPIDLEPIVMPWVSPSHQWCLKNAPASRYRDWYRAIVCGENLPPSAEKTWFQNSGLIHVIVVSGSHLVFLEDILKVILGTSRWAGWVRWLALIFFSMISNLQPPITRALIQRAWGWHFARENKKMGSLHLQLLSGFSTVALFPGWWTSLSFLMSWFCVLALSVPLPSKNPLWRAALIYILMIPAMLSVQIPQPGSILFNVVFAPILGLVLFPMSLAGFFHPWLAFISDKGWDSLFWLFSYLPMPEGSAGMVFSGIWLITYLFVAQAGSFYYLIQTQRRLWNFSSSSS